MRRVLLLLKKSRKTGPVTIKWRTTPQTGCALGAPPKERRSSFAGRWRAAAPFALLALLRLAAGAQGPDPTKDHLPPMRLPANPNLPTLFIIGDSTVRNGQGDGKNGQWGWGDLIWQYFDPTKLNVVNYALGGRSSRTFISEGHWDQVMALLKPGDFVMMQFGHNDGGAINDKSRARGTIPGVGNDSQEIDNELTGKHEIVHSYGWYMRKYVTDTRSKGATPIICTMIPRKIWKDGKIVRNSGDYAGWAALVARGEAVPLVDLNEIVARRYDAMGPAKVEPLFGDEHTHTTLAGAELNAECVIAGLKRLPSNPLQKYFSDKAQNVQSARNPEIRPEQMAFPTTDSAV